VDLAGDHLLTRAHAIVLGQPHLFEDNSHLEQQIASRFPAISERGDSFTSINHIIPAMGNPYGRPAYTPGGIRHTPGALSEAVNFPYRLKPNPDSGSSNIRGQSALRCTEAPCHQFREMRNQTSTEGRWEGVTSASKAPQLDLCLKLVDRVNRVNEAFSECYKCPWGRKMAQVCADSLAIQMPENILQVFAQAYKSRGELGREVQESKHFHGGVKRMEGECG